ncbi:MAG: hypothetical protein L0219_20110 [Phycisphaerales bacterium]|nr:hypothetical protein [Phycisphaerales bacterium]
MVATSPGCVCSTSFTGVDAPHGGLAGEGGTITIVTSSTLSTGTIDLLYAGLSAAGGGGGNGAWGGDSGACDPCVYCPPGGRGGNGAPGGNGATIQLVANSYMLATASFNVNGGDAGSNGRGGIFEGLANPEWVPAGVDGQVLLGTTPCSSCQLIVYEQHNSPPGDPGPDCPGSPPCPPGS